MCSVIQNAQQVKFLGAQNRKSNKLELFECIVHTDLANPQFTVQGSKVLNYEATLSINNSKYNKINLNFP